MQWFSFGVAVLASLGIIGIGGLYILNPSAAARGFGLPLPDGPNMVWWLRLKGVRDIVSGLVVLAMMLWAEPRILGIVLLIESFTALGDMSLILAARGSTRAAFGMHAPTAALMILAALPLILGVV